MSILFFFRIPKLLRPFKIHYSFVVAIAVAVVVVVVVVVVVCIRRLIDRNGQDRQEH